MDKSTRLKPKIRCPHCRSRALAAIETANTILSFFFDKEGLLEADNQEPGDIVSLLCKCSECGHIWHPRRKHTVYDLVD
jgi:uncharacterized OB-fold protein